MASTIGSRTTRAWLLPLGSRAPGKRPPRRGLIWVGLALLAGYLLFCHGCHGDEDNELFIGARNQAAMKAVSAP